MQVPDRLEVAGDLLHVVAHGAEDGGERGQLLGGGHRLEFRARELASDHGSLLRDSTQPEELCHLDLVKES